MKCRGRGDSTEAFREAVAAAKGGVVGIPPGEFTLTRSLGGAATFRGVTATDVGVAGTYQLPVPGGQRHLRDQRRRWRLRL
ncbi:hypothetical protein P3L51_06215 [Streptomyces sp. PSRA5]|uniref:hypothetical protein n=1 Tax=Streptomyces panacea TaxID=3035064 RepID=UPI00339C1CFF